MIPRDYITEWRTCAPWVDDAQVEQDLVICKALIDIFSNDTLHDALAFRGGTALFKLHLPPARYSEDIDLVQINAQRAGPIIDALREVLDPWLGEPRRKQKESLVTLIYRFQSEDLQPLRLKVEINTREHFAIEGYKKMPFGINSRWYEGSCSIQSYDINELLGTKLRALYQRKKGRDLFDLAIALDHTDADPKKIIDTFYKYMKFGGFNVTRSQFIENIEHKMKDKNFTSDISPLLATGYVWNPEAMLNRVYESLITHLSD